ncbi:hypothetical protein [Parapedobacter sp. 10938]|uniref:hypothetical protein n=1 Tax=Parapedobacter flavus TaxID=3110225 RepID=UPI002DBFA93B|nr:hypothetical protein [Parapedobacter sp. 10938]MEC3881400.1 hypothetical protein [Parapedobacter sp. 10938]
MKTTGDGPRPRRNVLIPLDDLSVSNQRSGFSPYIDVRAGVGFRLFSQRELAHHL